MADQMITTVEFVNIFTGVINTVYAYYKSANV